MVEDQIKIRKIQLKELAGWAASIPSQPAFRKVVPMTLTRALSQTQNPYARQEDVVLAVASKEDQCIGYHGLLPAVLKHGNNMARVHWATTFYVSPDFRGQGIGKRLLEEIKDFQIDCVVCQITASAQRTYRSSGFQDLGQLSYFQLRVDRLDFLSRFLDAAAGWLRKNCSRGPSRRPALIHLLQRPVYRLTKRLSYRLAARSGHRQPDRKFTWETVARIDPSLFDDEIAVYLALKHARVYLADRIEYPCHLEIYFNRHTEFKKLIKKQSRLYMFYPRSSQSPLAVYRETIALDYCDGDTPMA